MELASRQSGARWFIRSSQSRGQRGWFVGCMERVRRQPHSHLSRYDRGECDMAAGALGTRMYEDGIWHNRSAIIGGLGQNDVCGFLPGIPRATVRRSERYD